jgi:hypothetical protein
MQTHLQGLVRETAEASQALRRQLEKRHSEHSAQQKALEERSQEVAELDGTAGS